MDTKIDDATYEVLPRCNIQYDLDQLTAPLSEQEIETALKQFKKNSALGIDDIRTEILILASETTVSWIKVLADQIWLEEGILKTGENK